MSLCVVVLIFCFVFISEMKSEFSLSQCPFRNVSFSSPCFLSDCVRVAHFTCVKPSDNPWQWFCRLFGRSVDRSLVHSAVVCLIVDGPSRVVDDSRYL